MTDPMVQEEMEVLWAIYPDKLHIETKDSTTTIRMTFDPADYAHCDEGFVILDVTLTLNERVCPYSLLTMRAAPIHAN